LFEIATFLREAVLGNLFARRYILPLLNIPYAFLRSANLQSNHRNKRFRWALLPAPSMSMKIEQNLETELSDLSPMSRVRELGSYYTPDQTAGAVARWAIRTGHEAILEPSAGGGALLVAAFARSGELSSKPLARALAFDIDPDAITKLNALRIAELTVRHGDFLEQSIGDKFDIVLANPPFNRNHSLLASRRAILRKRLRAPGAIGLWGYFLLHALDSLRGGGRLASIVPRSVLFTAHGDKFLKMLSGRFSTVGIYELSSKPSWSNFADEAGAVILAEGFGGKIRGTYLRGTLHNDGSVVNLQPLQCESYSRIEEHTAQLGSFAELSIGVVTGRNKVFLLTEAERESAGLSLAHVRPVVSRGKQLVGLSMTREDLLASARDGNKTWLLAPQKLYASVGRYLKVVSLEDRETVVWFKKRNPWWKIQLGDENDAVFTYMNDLGPRIVAVSPGIICTNTLHRVKFREVTTEAQRRAVLLTTISTFGQLAAERIGRSYGGGLLKFELAEARRLPIVKCDAFSPALVSKIDVMLKEGKVIDATNAVDEAFMPDIFGKAWKDAVQALKSDLKKLRDQRRGKKGNSDI
jgi:adenine-specific DNA-methyltransferase